MLQLFTYYRSVSAHRVRIALNLKAVPYKSIFLDMDADEHHKEEYLRLNPQGLVPLLVVNEDFVISQSTAILEYLEERYPERALLPKDTELRARIRSFAQIAVADTQPMNTLRVYYFMRDVAGIGYDLRRAWYEHWMQEGLKAMESVLAGSKYFDGAYCFGDRPSLADICLVPQCYNAEKNEIDLSPYPTLRSVYRYAMTTAAFQAAAPDTQADRLAHAD